MSYKVHEIAREIEVEVVNESNAVITHVADLDDAVQGSISFASSKQYLDKLKATKASAPN